jgi:hypothetical protein
MSKSNTKYPKAQIRSLAELNGVVMKKRSVYCPKTHVWQKPRAAAFIINLPGRVLLDLFEYGMFVYEPQRNKGKKGIL